MRGTRPAVVGQIALPTGNIEPLTGYITGDRSHDRGVVRTGWEIEVSERILVLRVVSTSTGSLWYEVLSERGVAWIRAEWAVTV